MSCVASWVGAVFRDISPAWRTLLLSRTTRPLFTKALEKLEETLQKQGPIPEALVPVVVRPHPAMFLETFRYAEPSEIRVVIVGQDPYLHPYEACGMSFSVPPGVRVPPSLRNVYKAACPDDTPSTGDLRSWTRQGVLLLNRYLSRSPKFKRSEAGTPGGEDDEAVAYLALEGVGKKATAEGITVEVTDDKNDDLHQFWDDYTTAVLRELLAVTPKCCLMLWGNFAKELRELEDDFPQHTFLCYRHPSPMAGADFSDCDHFRKASKVIGPIHWNPTRGRDNRVLLVASDGGCRGNGREGARAMAGVYVPEEYCGENLLHTALAAAGQEDSIEWTFRLDGEEWRWEAGKARHRRGTQATTNGRSELLGLLKALELVTDWYRQRPGRLCPVHLVLDSTYAINVLQYLIWKETDKELANGDLLRAIRAAALELAGFLPQTAEAYKSGRPRDRLIHPDCRRWEALVKSDGRGVDDEYYHWTGITVYHVESHKKEPPADRDARTAHWYRWKANRRADELSCPPP